MITTLIAATLLSQNTVLSGTVSDGKKSLDDVAVWLEGGAKSSPITAKIDQKDMRFVPRILVVPKGSTINFPNGDAVYHNVFAEFEAKTFDLGMYPKGQSRSVTFQRPGIVSVLCNIHAEMSAYIVVVDSPHYAKSGKGGKFKFSAPPGQYTLRAWHESGKSESRPLTVGGEPLELAVTITKK